MDARALPLAVAGGAECGEETAALAWRVGREIARRGAVLLCGGRGGVMEAAAAGAAEAGGWTVGILPGGSPSESPPNPHIQLPVYTGMGQARNQILVLSARALIAVGGDWGTLSEIALARKQGIPVVLLDSWRLERPLGEGATDLLTATSPEEAVSMALDAVHRSVEGEPA
jgi:uncharacterized protein (TIGR00725 family)